MRRGTIIALLLAAPVLLLVTGIAIIASTSGLACVRYNIKDLNYFLVRQLFFATGAVVLAAIVASVNHPFWSRKSIMWLLAMAILGGLASVFIPGLEAPHKGSHRWIDIGFCELQPSEFVKLALFVLIAAWQGRVSRRNDRFWEGCVVPTVALGVVAGGFMLQPDVGATFVTGVIAVAMMFVAGVRIAYLAGVGVVGSIVLAVYISLNPERLARVMSFLFPATADIGEGYQVDQSMGAFQNGGVGGVGYGHSFFKELYVPDSHTDFILSMVGEELGLAGSVLVVGCFVMLLVAGVWASMRAPDRFGRLLAFGMTFYVCFSAMLNIAVVTGFFPPKGLALPFMSYGGSSLLTSMVAIGFILSVARRAGRRGTPNLPVIALDALPECPDSPLPEAS